MKVRALRGVVVGVEDAMKKDEVRDLPEDKAKYLKAIGAVEDAPAESAAKKA